MNSEKAIQSKKTEKNAALKGASLLPNLLLALFSIFFAVGVLEISLAIVYPDKLAQPEQIRSSWVNVPERIWTEYHPVLGWYHQKNRKALLEGNGFSVELHTNSAGFRGQRDYPKERVEGKKRLLVLGDSFVFGWGVQDSEVLAARVEARDPSYEVLNAGVPGYGIDQIYLTYKHIGREYKSDIVFIGIFDEDFWRSTRSFADTGHAKPYFVLTRGGRELALKNVPVPPQYSLKTDQFPSVIEQGPVMRVIEKSRVYKAVRPALLKLARNLRLIDPDMSREWVLGKAILKQLVDEIRADGARPVLLTVPSQYWAQSSRPTSLARSLQRFAQKEGVDLLDTTPSFVKAVQERGLASYYIPGDGHWNAGGHELAADLIFDWLGKSVQHG